MAWAHVANYNGTGNKSAGTAATATGVAYNTGDVLFACVACDDISAADAIGTTAVTGGTGLSWTRIGTNQAQSAAGAVAQAIFVAQAASNQTGQTITFTPSSSSAAKDLSILRFSGGVTTTFASNAINSGSASPFTCDARSADNGGLCIGFIAREGDTGDSFTGDSDTTNGSWSAVVTDGTSGGGAAGNVRLDTQWKITSASGSQTYDPTGTSRDWRGLMISMSSPNATIAATAITTTTTMPAPVVPATPPIDGSGGEDAYTHMVPFDTTDHRYAVLWGRDQGSLSGDRRFRLFATNSDASLIYPAGAAATGDGAGIGMDAAPKASWRQSPTQVGYLHQRYHGGANIATVYSALLAYNSGTDVMSNGGFGANTLQPVGVSDGGTNDAYGCRMADDKALIVASQNIDASTLNVRCEALVAASSSSTSWTQGTVLNVSNPASAAEVFIVRCIGFSDTRAVVLTEVTSGSTGKIYGQIIGCTSGTGQTLSTVGSWQELNDEFHTGAGVGAWSFVKIDSTRFLLIYGEAATNVSTDRRLMCRIIDIASDTWTLGTELELENDTTTIASLWHAQDHSVYLGSNKVFLTAYRASTLNATYGTIASNTMTSNTSMTITKPTSTASGDFLWAFFAIDGDNGSITITKPDGWVEHTTAVNSGNVGLRSFYKQAGGSEPADYTFTFSSSCTAVGSIVRMTGGSAQHSTPWTAANTGTGSNPTLAHNIGGDTMLAVSATDTDVAHTPPTGYTERLDLGAGSTVRLSIASDANIGTGGSALPFTASSTNWATLHVPTPSYESPTLGYIVNVGASGTTVTLDTDATTMFDYDARQDSQQYHFESYLTAVSNKITRSGGIFTPGAGGGTVYDQANTGFMDIPSDVSATVPVAAAIATVSTVGVPTIQTGATFTPPTIATTSAVGVPTIPVLVPVATIATRTYIQSGSYLNLPGFDVNSWTNVIDLGGTDLDFLSSDMEGEVWMTVTDSFTHGSVVWLLQSKTNTLDVAAGGWLVQKDAAGGMRMRWGDGTTAHNSGVTSATLQSVLELGKKFGLKWTWERTAAGGNWQVKFFYNKDEGAGWQQLGNTLTGAVAGSMAAAAQTMRHGADLFGNNGAMAARFYSLKMRDGVDGTLLVDVDWTKQPSGTQTFTEAVSGRSVTRGSTTSLVGLVNTGVSFTPPTIATTTKVGGGTWLLLPGGATGSAATTPDTGVLDIVGDIDVRVIDLVANDYSTGASQTIVSKWVDLGFNERSWILRLTTTGQLSWLWSTDGTAFNFHTTGNTIYTETGVTDGRPISVRVTMDVDSGGGNRTTRFYYSFDQGATWTQYGGDHTSAGTTSIYASSGSALSVGAHNNTVTQHLAGKVGRIEVRDGINGTVVANPNFDAQPAGTTSFTDGAGRTWSMGSLASINGLVSTGVTFTPPTIATATAVGVPLVRTGATPTPPAITTVTAVGVPTISTGATPTPPAIATVTAVGVPQTQVGSTISATTIVTTSTVPAITFRANATPAPPVVVTSSTVGVPLVRTGATPTPPSIATVTAVGVPQTQVGVTIAATTVTTVTAVGVPVVRVGATFTPPAIATASAVGVPTISTGSTIAATTVATASAVGVPLVRTGATTAPPAIVTASSVGVPTISAGSTVPATAIVTSSSVGVPATLTQTVITPPTIVTVSTVGVPTIQTATNATVPATAIATVTAVGVPLVQTGATPTPPAIVTASTVGVPTVSTGSTVTTTTVATVTAVGAPVTQTGATIAATTIATGSQVGTITFTAPATAAPPAIATVTAVGVPQLSTGAGPTPPTIVTSSTVGAPAVNVGVTIAATTVATTSSVGVPTVSTGSTIAATAIATATQVGVPVTQTGATVSAVTIATASQVGTISFTAPAATTPPAIATASAVGAPTISAGATVTATAIATVSAVGTAAIQTEGNANVGTTTVATSSSVGVPTISTGATIAATAIETASQVGVPVTQTGATVSAVTIATASTVGVPVVQTGTTLAAAEIPTATSVGVPTISAGATVTATTVDTTSSVGVPVSSTGATPTPATIATATDLPAPVVQTSGNANAAPATIATVSQVGVPVASTSSTAAPATIATTTAIAAPTVDTASNPAPATIATVTAISAPVLSTSTTPAPATVATASQLGAPTISAGAAAPVSTIGTSSQVGVVLVSTSAAAVVTTIGTTVQIQPITIEAGATVLAQAIATHSQVGIVIAGQGVVLAIPVTISTGFESRTISTTFKARGLSTQVAEREIGTVFTGGLTIRSEE